MTETDLCFGYGYHTDFDSLINQVEERREQGLSLIGVATLLPGHTRLRQGDREIMVYQGQGEPSRFDVQIGPSGKMRTVDEIWGDSTMLSGFSEVDNP